MKAPVTTPVPDERMAADIFRAHFPDPVSSVRRFPTGLCHHVFEVRTTANRAYVVRLASAASRRELEGGLYWHPRLKAVLVPVPALYASGVAGPNPYMLLERLPGTDLENVYGDLPAQAKKALAERLAAMQASVGTLPQARGFGFAVSYEEAGATGRHSWVDVVATQIERSDQRIREAGRIDPGFVNRVRAAAARHESYLQAVAPVPFLDDATTRNVIVNEGVLAGIVDTDEVCFGDSLFTVGLTNAALLSLGFDTDYVGYWLDAIGANRQQRTIVTLYTLVFCLNLMSELGQTFNRPVMFDEARAETLRRIFERQAESLRASV